MPKLIPEWKISWRFTSVQAAAVLVVLSMIQADALPYVQPMVPAKYWPFVSGGLGIAIVIFRILAQVGLRAPQEPKS